MGKEIVSEAQEAQRVPYRINPRRNMPRHILIKLSKTKYKEKILKAAREKQQITYKGIAQEELQEGGRVRHGDHLPPHK